MLRGILICVVYVSCCLSGQGLWAGSWQAGVARTVITPEELMWMAGYGSRNHEAEGTLHDLWAKAIVLQNEAGQRGVLISLDLVGISRTSTAEIYSLLKEQYGFARAEIVLCTSHTHCGPVMSDTLASMYFVNEEQQKKIDAYTAAFPEKIAELVGQALQKLEPVSISYGTGTCSVAVNRRENVEAEVPKLREAGQLKGPVDHDLPVVFVKNANGQMKAILFNYACHATTLSFYQWNGDWPGFAQIELEKAFPGATALFVAGCGADQNPLPRRTVELAEKYGRDICEGVVKLSQQKLTPVNDQFAVAYKEIPLALAELPTKKQIENDAAVADKFVASRARHLLRLIEANGHLEQTYPYPIQVWNLGGARLVFLGGEVVVDYSLRIKGDLETPPLWVAGYCNDVMAYIPSRRVLLEGGYEGARSMIYYGMPTVWAPEIENLIIEQVTQFVQQVDMP